MVQVPVYEGILEGEEVQNEYGGTYYSFKGIPYAQPPVGDLRFKAPEPPVSWTGIKDATKFRPICYQNNYWDTGSQTEMSEDCLYLNVYTPEIQPKKLQPVMLFIHGGGYLVGSGDDNYFGPEFLVRHGVILVTFNYRLGAIGFLTLHSPEIPGNAGIKDQVQAMRWVKKNILKFGGDPDNITIFGESAGAYSVSYHLVSPMTKGLFRRAIIQSGVAITFPSIEFQGREKSVLLARQLGCFTEDDKTLYDFFQKQPIESLVNLNLKVWTAQKPFEIPFEVVDEKDYGQERFFYGDVLGAVRKNVHEGVEIMIGSTKDEAITIMGINYSAELMMNDAKYYSEFFIPGAIKRYCVVDDQFEVGRKLRQYYVKDGEVVLEQLLKFIATDVFHYPNMLTAKIHSMTNKVYFYKFNIVTERNVFALLDPPEPYRAENVVCHGDDLAYIFPLKKILGKVDMNSETFNAINRVCKLWTNFAKFGNPTPSTDKSLGVEWKPYTIEKQEYLDIGNTLRMDSEPDKEELELWENIYKKYLPKYTF